MKSKDQQMLEEAYEAVLSKQLNEKHKCPCGCDQCGPDCPCDADCECKCKEDLKEGKKKKKSSEKPDYLDVDGDNNKKESMKKALNDKK